jgi:hypothetical protein
MGMGEVLPFEAEQRPSDWMYDHLVFFVILLIAE